MPQDAYIIARARTPIGSFGGSLASVPATELGSIAIRAVLQRGGVDPSDVDEVIFGNVVSAGLGQNPARQASIGAGLPTSVGATTVNKVCGSGLKSVMLAAQAIQLKQAHVIVAGGTENMSRAPYLLPEARTGYRMGSGEMIDSMIHDGLRDAYGGRSMGVYGDRCAEKYDLTRQQQDDFAVRSYTRARQATADGIFSQEIVPVEVTQKRKTVTVREDEEPTRFDEEKLRSLRPAFNDDGTVTAGNASSINDGAAALLVVSEDRLGGLAGRPAARIVGGATFSREPEWFTIAPIGALKKLLDQVGWTVDDTDLFEINEAFAAVTLVAERELAIPPEKVNILGGAVALGHPIGCSGARVLVTLLTGLLHTGGKRGIACLCVGGGEAVALAVEMAQR
ncbi:MAG: thiolase family protein [Pirellulales bacterium]